ncbi:winged helix-turn-helix transcriptional regulator [Streptomyces palmae]|uniref:Transcriptional regulator n=1 Tax=Streptomyces palmae TaxID=1701085 RepID=A0A4Z0H733_9ACTN|nr:helix-turn-helix domain-containing protein [Streptomyces palmae]TGB09169.1 transcriptional regulator [Streptomyces palmae]
MGSALRSQLEAAGVSPECASTIELVRDVLARVGDKWTVLVVITLADGPLRFTTLHGRIAGVSQRMLSQTLRSLTRDGLVTRTAYAEVPPRVEYELTPLGRSLSDSVTHVVHWVQDHQAEIVRNRQEFDGGDLPTP